MWWNTHIRDKISSLSNAVYRHCRGQSWLVPPLVGRVGCREQSNSEATSLIVLVFVLSVVNEVTFVICIFIGPVIFYRCNQFCGRL